MTPLKTIIGCLSIIYIIFSCRTKPVFPISNTLEIALEQNGKYEEYVQLLNHAQGNDLTALRTFLTIDWIADAAGYNHAFMLSYILEQKNDTTLLPILKAMTATEITSLKSYLDVAIDQSNGEVLKKLSAICPQSVAFLGFKK